MDKLDFTVLTPKKIPDDCTLEIKTYPWGKKTTSSILDCILWTRKIPN